MNEDSHPAVLQVLAAIRFFDPPVDSHIAPADERVLSAMLKGSYPNDHMLYFDLVRVQANLRALGHVRVATQLVGFALEGLKDSSLLGEVESASQALQLAAGQQRTPLSPSARALSSTVKDPPSRGVGLRRRS